MEVKGKNQKQGCDKEGEASQKAEGMGKRVKANNEEANIFKVHYMPIGKCRNETLYYVQFI